MGGAGGASGAEPGAPAPPPPADAGRPTDLAPLPRTGILLRLADFPPVNIGSGTGSTGQTSTTTTGGGPDPNTQYIVIGDPTPTCASPYQYVCPNWHVSIGIPPADFKPGVFPLQYGCANLNAWYSMSLADPGGGNCSSGTGGTFSPGTLEILSVTTSGATIRLTNTPSPGFYADGVYQLTRCPAR